MALPVYMFNTGWKMTVVAKICAKCGTFLWKPHAVWFCSVFWHPCLYYHVFLVYSAVKCVRKIRLLYPFQRMKKVSKELVDPNDQHSKC